MPKYIYKAINEIGNAVSGVIEAESLETANNALIARGNIPTMVSLEHGLAARSGWASIREIFSKVNTPELILFTKQFKTMLHAGVPMVKLLQVLEDQTASLKLKSILGSMSQDIKEGSSLYNAFKKYPKTFSSLYCSMIRAGEASGALPEVMERLTYIIEHEHRVKSDIKAALQYPLIVLVFLFIAFFVLLTFVIPKFVNIFERSGIDIPVPTMICMTLYSFMVNYWYIFFGLLILSAAFLRYYFKTDNGRYVRDVFLMKVPIIGPLFIKSAMSRFASIFSILQSSGVAVLESMNILSGTINNSAISREFDRINEKLEEGRGIAEPLKSAKYFTPIVTNMIAIGEESGNLDEMLNEISDHYDVELEYAVKKLSEAMGPILTIGLAGIVGFFALSIFLPMWDMTKMVK